MDNGRVDVLIPTAGKRVDGLIYQINAFVDQSYTHKTIWVLIDVDSDAEFHVLRARIFDRTRRYAPIEIIRVPEDYRGKHGHGPIRYAIERLELTGDWIITSGDDDSVMPWALEELKLPIRSSPSFCCQPFVLMWTWILTPAVPYHLSSVSCRVSTRSTVASFAK